MKDIIHDLVNDLVEWCERDQLATISEGHMKAEVMRSLLGRGAVLLEGSNVAGRGWRIASGVDELESTLVELPLAESKPDVRVVCPVDLTLELKVRPDFGSLAQARSAQFEKDFQNVEESRADALVVAFGPIGYQSMRGVKQDARGRKPTFTLEGLLPAPGDIQTGKAGLSQGVRGQSLFDVLSGRAANGRVVVAICREAMA